LIAIFGVLRRNRTPSESVAPRRESDEDADRLDDEPGDTRDSSANCASRQSVSSALLRVRFTSTLPICLPAITSKMR
jgi:hypothetical protein